MHAPRPRLTAVDGGANVVPDDDDLLIAVAHGDREAFEALYGRFAATVFGVVRRTLRDPSQSEEVAQEVFVELWRQAARFDPERGRASTWILTLAHRRAVDRVRTEQSRRDRTDRVAAREHRREHDEVAETVELRLEHQQVRAALDVLTPLQREAVELAYYRGFTYREVAEQLGAPLGTIKTRMRDGLIRMRDALGVMG